MTLIYFLKTNIMGEELKKTHTVSHKAMDPKILKLYTLSRLKVPPNRPLFSGTCYSGVNQIRDCPTPLGYTIQTVESRTPLLLSAYPWGKCSCKIALMLKRLGNFETRGTYAFHSAQNSRSFRGNQMDWTILVWPGQNIKLVPYDWSCWSD